MKKKRAPRPQKPIEIKEGSVVVTITSEKNQVGGKKYWRHNLIYFEGGERIRRRFSDLSAAKAEAEVVAIKLSNREGEVLKLAPADRAHYLQANELLARHDPQLRLNLAVSQYVEAAALPCLEIFIPLLSHPHGFAGMGGVRTSSFSRTAPSVAPPSGAP